MLYEAREDKYCKILASLNMKPSLIFSDRSFLRKFEAG